MNAQKYTQKSLGAVQAAQALTIENQNQQIEQVHLLAALLRQANAPKDILTICYEPVTGAHVGPGALALFFLGEDSFRG